VEHIKGEMSNLLITQFINVLRDTLVLQTKIHEKIGMGNYSLIFIMNRMKNKEYHTIGTVPKSDKKIIETETK